MPKRRTQQQFIEEAIEKHAGFYEYSKVSYVNSGIKVTVSCPQHGDFEVTPSHHLNGVGCRKCHFDSLRNSQETIIARFCNTHSDRYDYSLVNYQDITAKVTIVCSTHGSFQQAPIAHITGSGCQKCANEGQALTKQEFIAKARAKHGDRYDYSQVKYIKISNKITIVCLKHGAFEQIAGNHLRGSNCPECSKLSIVEAQFGFEYQGIQYRSIKDACQKLNKDYWSVVKRLDSGWTKEEAFEDKPRQDPRHFLKVNGVAYNGIQDAVRKLNAPVSAATVRRRLEKGMSIEEALLTPPKLGYDNGIIYLITNVLNGKQYIGLTTTSLQERWARHKDQALSKKASLVHKAIAEDSQENFTIKTIDRASSIKELKTKERYCINALNTLAPSGYNVTLGGEIGGSPGKPTRLPGDSTLYPSVKAAALALAKREGISEEAAEKRIHTGRIEVKKPHGMSKTRIYKCWDRVAHQVTNPNCKDYDGAMLCDQWRTFTNFYQDMGKSYKDGYTLKRIDSNLPYCASNCKWQECNSTKVSSGETNLPV